MQELQQENDYGPNTEYVERFFFLFRLMSFDQWDKSYCDALDLFDVSRDEAILAVEEVAWESQRTDFVEKAIKKAKDLGWSYSLKSSEDNMVLSNDYLNSYVPSKILWKKYGGVLGVEYAVQALVVRDLISKKHFKTLTKPLKDVGFDFKKMQINEKIKKELENKRKNYVLHKYPNWNDEYKHQIVGYTDNIGRLILEKGMNE